MASSFTAPILLAVASCPATIEADGPIELGAGLPGCDPAGHIQIQDPVEEDGGVSVAPGGAWAKVAG